MKTNQVICSGVTCKRNLRYRVSLKHQVSCALLTFWEYFSSRSKGKEDERLKKCGDVSKYQSLIEQYKFELANAVSTHLEVFELYGTFANASF